MLQHILSKVDENKEGEEDGRPLQPLREVELVEEEGDCGWFGGRGVD